MSINKILLRGQQTGVVSIVATTIFIIIIGLVTTSFALLMRREQRQALDRQLSSQAYYAAETGINDAIEKLKTNPTLADITSCSNESINTDAAKDLGNGLKLTCVLVNKTPKDLKYEIGTDNSKIVKVQATEAINRIRISWQDPDGSKEFAPSTQTDFELPTKTYLNSNPSYWANKTGILRASIIPVTPLMTRATLVSNTRTLFLYPRQSTGVGSSGLSSTNEQGAFTPGQCHDANPPRFCNVDITGPGMGQTTYYLRLKGIYRPADVSIQAFNATDVQLSLKGTQAVVDATGRAKDVIRRVQVRVPLNNDYHYPEFALETAGDICKLLDVRIIGDTKDGCEPYS